MNQPKVERRLAAILAADVVGYSRLMGIDEAGTLNALKTHRRELIDPLVAARSGRIVKTMGDGLLIEFPSVVDAVQCAVELQDGMAARNAAIPVDKCIAFRIGINVGDVIIEDGDVYGDGVNIAARLEQLAEPGGVCVSRAAYEQIRDKLPFPFQDMGEHTVKNIARPIQVWRFGHDRATLLGNPDAVAPPTMEPRKQRRLSVAAAVAAGLLVVFGTGAFFWLGQSPASSVSSAQLPGIGTPRLSIAVMPLVNLSYDKDQDYLADALTEDLTADLSRINGSFVISSGSTGTYRGKTVEPRQVARELKVRYLLDGNVRKTGGDLHVSAQLTDGETGQQIWSERFVKRTGDMFAFQNEVTGRVARALNLELKDALSRQAARGHSGNVVAADFALRAWAELWTKPQTRATNDAALGLVAKALALDPSNSEALGSAAYAHARAALYSWGTSVHESLKLGVASGEKAMAIDPKNTDAMYALGILYRTSGDNFKAGEIFSQCLAQNRNHAPSYYQYGVTLSNLGRGKEALPWIERAFALSPRDPLRALWHQAVARVHITAGEDAEAVIAARQGIAANPDQPYNYASLAAAYAHLGQVDEAKRALADLQQRLPVATVHYLQRTLTGGNAQAIASFERYWIGLRKAGLPE